MGKADVISLFLEHHSFKTARRALLLSAFITIIIPSMTVSGEGINIIGLKLHITQERILTVSRLTSAYFLWVFVWFLVPSTYSAVVRPVIKRSDSTLSKAQELARSADAEQQDWGGDHYHDLEPWWEEYREKKSKNEKLKYRVALLQSIFSSLGVLCVDYLPAICIGLLAVFFPHFTSAWIF